MILKQHETDARLKICRQCDLHKNGVCTRLTINLAANACLSATRCPEQKWPALKEEEGATDVSVVQEPTPEGPA